MIKTNKNEMDMLHGPLSGKLTRFALPLAASSILQQLFNSADVAVVGRFAGSDALAAVGANVAVAGIFINLAVGMSVGPNAFLASLIGQKRRGEISAAMHTTLSFAGLCGLFLMLVSELLSVPILRASGTPENILGQAALYVRIYMLGLPFMLIYNFGAAILRSFGDTRRPLICLILSGILNVGLNLLTVISFGMGVAGVAIATAVSNLFAAGLVLVFLIRERGEFRFSLKLLCLKPCYLKPVLKIGLPAGVQSMVFSISNVFVQTGINSFGSDAIAGSSVALNFEYFTYDIVAAYSQACVTFISQNYGAGDLARCRRVYALCMVYGMLFTQVLSCIFMLWRVFFVGLYTTSAAAADFAIRRMWRVAAIECLCATYECAGGALRACGRTLTPTVITICGTVGLRIIWMYTVFRLSPAYNSLMLIYPVSWCLTGAAMILALVLTARRISSGAVQR